ncbi:putative reverse transcriptase domain-containing protein [Tanacetum coccineum]
MTRSSIKELFTPYEEPERVLHSTRKLFKTTSLDYSSSPEFDLFSDLEDQCEEEVVETMGEPMEEYMTKTREDYRPGIARPKIDEKAHFELKGQFLKDLRDNTFSRSDNEDANEHIEKGLDIPTRQILDSKGDIPYLKAADAKKAIQDMADHLQKWHNRTSTRTRIDRTILRIVHLNKKGKHLKKHNTQFGVPFPQGGRYRATALGFYQRDNSNPSYQERRLTMEESLSKFMVESAKRHDENSNLINYEDKMILVELMDRKEFATNLKRLLKEKPMIGYQIETSTNMHESEILEDSLPLKDPGSFTIPCYINNICFEKALVDLGSSVSVMPYSTFTNLGLSELAPTRLIIELADRTIKCPKDMPKDIKVPLILGRPFLSTAHAKIDVFKREITLRVGDDKIMFKSENPTNNIIKRVFVLGLREQMELDLEARLIGEALILNRSLDPVYGDYIEINDLNEPLELRRNQVQDVGS